MNLMKSMIALACLAPVISYAEMHSVKKENFNPDEDITVKIIYNGDVNAKQVTELMSAIDEINNDYPSSSAIKLYINSAGGNMESGYLAYQAIKASTVPVETINAGMSASSATLMFCGAQKRYSLPEASFMLHPAGLKSVDAEWIRPNDIELIKKSVEYGNKYFRSIYSSCTTLTTKEIDSILFSNDNTRFIMGKDSEDIKLSQGVISGIPPAQISYYINNGED